jgi:hypothetical protein
MTRTSQIKDDLAANTELIQKGVEILTEAQNKYGVDGAARLLTGFCYSFVYDVLEGNERDALFLSAQIMLAIQGACAECEEDDDSEDGAMQ